MDDDLPVMRADESSQGTKSPVVKVLVTDNSQPEQLQLSPNVSIEKNPIHSASPLSRLPENDNARKTQGNFSMKSGKSGASEPPKEIKPLSEKEFRKALLLQEMGRPALITSRINSGISIQAQNARDIERTKKMVIKRAHPLKAIQDPATWKNIPPCVTSAIKAIYSHLMEGDASIYDYEVVTNGRLLKLQNSITKLRISQENFEQTSKVQLENKLKITEGNIFSRIKSLEAKLSENIDKTIANTVELKEINKSMNKQLETIRKQIRDQILAFEEHAEQALQKFEDNDERVGTINFNLHQDIKNKTTLEIFEDGETKITDLKSFILKNLEQQDEEKSELSKKLKVLDKKILETSNTMDYKIIEYNSNSQFETKFVNLQELIDNLTREFQETQEKREEHEQKCLEFQAKGISKPESSMNVMDSKPTSQGSNRASKSIKVLEQKFQQISEVILPQALEAMKKQITNSSNILNAKFDKKLKQMGKKLEEGLSSIPSTPLEVVAGVTPEGAPVGAPAVGVTASAGALDGPTMKSFDSSDQRDDDEYTKLLIEQELNNRLDDVFKKIEELKKIQPESMTSSFQGPAAQNNVPQQQTVINNQSTDTDLRLDVEELVEKVEKMQKVIKILQLTVESIPKKRMEDDPNYGEYEQYQNHVLGLDRRNSQQEMTNTGDIGQMKMKITRKLGQTFREKFLSKGKTASNQFTLSPEGQAAQTVVSLSPQRENSHESKNSVENISPQTVINNPVVKVSKQFNSYNASKKMIINTSFKGQTSVQQALAQNIESRDDPAVSQASLGNKTQRTRQSLQTDGALRVNPFSSRNDDDGFMTARNVPSHKINKSINPKNNESLRNSLALPQLAPNLRKKSQNKDAWGPNGTKFERIEGF